MMKKSLGGIAGIGAALAIGSAAIAQSTTIDFEDLTEGALGVPFDHQGLNWHDLNTVSGVFPNGDTFGPQIGDEVICEDATVWYNDFPTWGSADKLLTFGTAYIPGDSLSLGRLSNVTVDLENVADSMSVDVGYYENGPWGGIVIHVDVLRNGNIVGTDSFEIADGGGRDNGAIDSLAVSGVEFDQMMFYATYGNEYSLPRVILDDLTLNYVGGGATLSVNPDPLVAGRNGQFIVTNATPDTRTYLAYSLSGTGSTNVPFLNITLDLARPTQVGGMKMTDGTGAVTWTLPIPNQGRGRAIWLQAAQFENKTNVVATTIE